MKNVQSELSQFGMIIWNANVKELQDAPGSEYFRYLRLKSHEGAINQAKVDVAQAKFKGAVGEKEREGEQRKVTSHIESDAVVYEQAREVEMSDARAKLTVQRTGFNNLIEIANIEAQKKAQMRDAELQKEVELRRAMVLQESTRAEKVYISTYERCLLRLFKPRLLKHWRMHHSTRLGLMLMGSFTSKKKVRMPLS